MKEDVCPKCGSKDVIVGAFVLCCITCKWSYHNEYPCNVCGKPSRSSCSMGKKGEEIYHGCQDHPALEVYKKRIEDINTQAKK